MVDGRFAVHGVDAVGDSELPHHALAVADGVHRFLAAEGGQVTSRASRKRVDDDGPDR